MGSVWDWGYPPSVQVRCWPPFFGNVLVLRSSTAKLPAQRSLGIFSLYVMPKLYARRIVGVPVIGHQEAPRACGMARNWGCLWLYVAPPKNHCQCMEESGGMDAGDTVEWDKLRTQDWKEAVAECTGVRESGGEEWRMDEKDRWNLGAIKQYEVEKRKFIEGCYGPIPTGL